MNISNVGMEKSLRNQKTKQLLRFMATWFSLPIAFVVLTFGVYGRPLAEKAATGLAMPISVAWWVSLIFSLKCFRDGNRRVALVILGVSTLIYVPCSPIISRLLMLSLETKIQSFHPSPSDPLDSIVVLGGGTSEAPDGRAQLANSGDRIGLAAQLYQQGLVKRIVVTGDGLDGIGNISKKDPSVQAKRILIGTGVIESDIEELPGMNTFSEIQALKARTALWQGKQCGLLTSAFHMPRAVGLAKRAGVDVKPVASDYRGIDLEFTLLDLLPTAGSAQQFELAFKEYLGMMLGR